MSDAPVSARDAWQFLRDGNRRFVSGLPAHPNQDGAHRDTLTGGQTPFAALLGCSDSRLGAEMIFDVGLGDLFVVRNMGQTISQSVVGSLEYAVAVLNVQLILVLAHDSCGAVKAAVNARRDGAEDLPPNIRALTDAIQPAITRVIAKNAFTDVDDVNLDEVGEEHLRDTIGELLATSEIVAEAIASGDVGIVGATYNLREGHIVPSVVIGNIE